MAAESIYSALMEIKDVISNGGNNSGSGDNGGSQDSGSSAGGPVVVEITANFSANQEMESVECNYASTELYNLAYNGRIGAWRGKFMVGGSLLREFTMNVISLVPSTDAELANTNEIYFITSAGGTLDLFIRYDVELDEWIMGNVLETAAIFTREDTSVNVWMVDQSTVNPK